MAINSGRLNIRTVRIKYNLPAHSNRVNDQFEPAPPLELPCPCRSVSEGTEESEEHPTAICRAGIHPVGQLSERAGEYFFLVWEIWFGADQI